MEKHYENAVKAEDLRDLLEHIAWENLIKPEIEKTRSVYEKFLVRSVLGHNITLADGSLITKEQLAGRIEGMDYIENLFKEILRRGDRAVNFIKQQQDILQ